jgi:hypothetical protein
MFCWAGSGARGGRGELQQISIERRAKVEKISGQGLERKFH